MIDKDNWYDDDWTIEDEDDIENYTEDNPITPEQEAFAKELIDFLQSLIDDEEKMVAEEFTSEDNLLKHFNKHCIGNDVNKKSTKNNVYYDFKTVKSYSKYENRINNIFTKEGDYDFIDNIHDINNVNKKFYNLFTGDKYLFISGTFGLTNKYGAVSLGLHAFSSDVTTNYEKGNTVDIMIRSFTPKTVTLYPVDASKLKNKLAHIINKYSDIPLNISEDDRKLLEDNKKSYLDTSQIKSNGIYSVFNGWLKEPVQEKIPDIDMNDFEKQFKVWEDKYFNLLDALNVDDKNKSNQINESQDEDFDFNWDDIKDYNLEFAKEIYDIIDSFIDKDNITENFKSKSSLKYHFNKHCVGDKIKKSTKTNVLYDFTNIDDYKEYEKNYLNNKNNSDILILTSLGSPEHVADIFRKFFEGNKYLILDTLCGFQNNNKSVSIILHSFANKATTNYNQNTIDFNVTADDITKTLYPVDSYYLETKLNNVIQKYNINKLSIKINNGKEIKTESHESEYVPKSYSNPKIEQINNLIEDIYKLRQEGMKEEGEYSIKNLIFKEFRNLGYLDNLKELKRKEVSKELSLEGLDKK